MTQEEQKVQELLKPRYKVIEPWPEMERWLARVGDILTDPGGNETVRNQNGDAVPAFEWETFPHLFKPLEWWEERDASEMPEYVKPDPNGVLEYLRSEKTIYKVLEWVRDDNNLWCKVGDHDHIHVNHILPATESEYNAYIYEQPTTQNQGV